MTSWFDTQEKVDTLEAVASSWVGTPFVANSRCKGLRGGVSCQMLAEQIYLECGITFPVTAPRASMRWSHVSSQSKIQEFLSALEGFQEIPQPALSDILPGDLLGFKIGKCLHHLGVALQNGRFIHCMRGTQTLIVMQSDPTFLTRLDKIWRIKP